MLILGGAEVLATASTTQFALKGHGAPITYKEVPRKRFGLAGEHNKPIPCY